MSNLKKRRLISARLYIASLFLIISICTPARAETLRVGLLHYFRGVAEISVSASTNYRIIDAKSAETIVSASSSDLYKLQASDHGILLTGPDGKIQDVSDDVEVKPDDPSGIVSISSIRNTGIKYRGVLEVHNKTRRLDLVDRIGLEDYLLGVVPSEMPPAFHMEALKAQAVAARTYALVTKGKHKDLGYDVCDETNCQCYRGVCSENKSATRAVKDTAGLIMTSGGKPIDSLFSSDCGGHTVDGNKPYLKAVDDCPDDSSDEYCSINANHNWMVCISADQFESLLAESAAGPICGLENVCTKDVDDCGRVKTVQIKDENGVHTISSVELRKLFGKYSFRSDRYDIKRESSGKISICGKGGGHGIGMCQHGANGMASAPYCKTYDKILKHYYSGISIDTMDSRSARN